MLTALIVRKMNIKTRTWFINLPVPTVQIREVHTLKTEANTHYEDFTSRMHIQVYTLQRINSPEH